MVNTLRKIFPAGIYLLKVNNRNTRTRCEICSKLTIKIPERPYWRRSSVSIVNFEYVTAGWIPEYGFSLSCVFLYRGRIKDSVLIRENTSQRKPVFWNILRSDTFMRKNCLITPLKGGYKKWVVNPNREQKWKWLKLMKIVFFC